MLREILDGLNRGRALEQRLTELSMGMSHDFEAAIEEGATFLGRSQVGKGAGSKPAGSGPAPGGPRPQP